MDKHLFVDTNILIDVLTGRDGSEASKRLFALAHLKKVQLSVSALSIVNAVYICKRYKMDIAAVLKALQTISTFVQVEDLTSDNVLLNLTSGWKDYEDATQAYCAQEHAIQCIVTRNTKDFSPSSLKVLLPEEALSYVNE